MPTGIPYCDEVLNVQAGCTKIGSGCKNCWAERMTIRQNGMAKIRGDQDKWSAYSSVLSYNTATGKATGWNGNVVTFPERLNIPLKWRKPRTIFVNSMSDTFHEKAPFEFIYKIWNMIFDTPRHTYLLFTKRPERALDFCHYMAAYWRGPKAWPDNVQFFVSASTQAEVDKAVPILLQIPAAVRGLSLEPLLEPIDFGLISQISCPTLVEWTCGHKGVAFVGDKFPARRGFGGAKDWNDPGYQTCCADCGNEQYKMNIDQIIVGCESGPNRRPCNIEWVESIVEQCKEAGVCCYVKQLELLKTGKKAHTLSSYVETDFNKFQAHLRVRQWQRKES